MCLPACLPADLAAWHCATEGEGGNSSKLLPSPLALHPSNHPLPYLYPRATPHSDGPQRVFPAVRVWDPQSRCGRQYKITVYDTARPLSELAQRCRVPLRCLYRANFAFFKAQAFTINRCAGWCVGVEQVSFEGLTEEGADGWGVPVC